MERAGKFLGRTRLRVMEVAGVRTYHLAPGAWSAAVGKVVAGHTRAAFLDGSRLIVEVEDAVWKAQLTTMRGQILARLEKVLGTGIIDQIEFRDLPRKRRPECATEALPQITDEAEHIEDPIMRRIYKQARRKATA